MFDYKNFFSFRNYDWPLTIIVLVLAAIGLTGIYSIDLSRGDKLTFFPTQVVALLIGLVIMIAASSFQVTFYRSSARLAYIIALVLLVGVLIFWTDH